MCVYTSFIIKHPHWVRFLFIECSPAARKHTQEKTLKKKWCFRAHLYCVVNCYTWRWFFLALGCLHCVSAALPEKPDQLVSRLSWFGMELPGFSLQLHLECLLSLLPTVGVEVF